MWASLLEACQVQCWYVGSKGGGFTSQGCFIAGLTPACPNTSLTLCPAPGPLCTCLQRFLTSTMQNLSTQSMLLALGLGAKSSVAASAAINWLLKDGVGRIARMTVATQFCQSFDSDLKV